jgi:3-phenylpropionate/trans-cinnamate dioxygenase ferredoxin reductase subunit
MVAGYAAKEFVERGGRSGDLTIISADTALPYERPPLSKSFLTGKDQEENIYISNAAFYRDHGIDVRLNTEVSSVDFAAKRLVLSDAREFGYEKLVIATGAHPRTLDVPGSNLDGIFYLRSLDDSRRIRDKSASGTRAVVIGGGFIAMEAASSLAQRGVEVTMVVREDRIWKAFFTKEMSASFRRYYESHGVKLVFGTGIAGFQGAGTVKFVALENGQRVECDFVVAGIGVMPVVDMFNVLAIRNGVLVNEFLETSAPDVYAAGDVGNYKDVLFEKQRRVEHWDNAVSQGQHVMRTLLGDRSPFVHVPYFFSDVFDLSYEFWGDASSAARTLYRGDVNSTSFSAWWLDDADRLVAAFVMNRPDDERNSAPKWIEAKQVLSLDRLADPHPLDSST